MKTQIFNAAEITSRQICQLAADLAADAVAVFATDTVYGMGTGAFCEPSVQKIYTIKKRPSTQPLQLLVADVAAAQRISLMSDGVVRLAQTYWPGGLTLILPSNAAGQPLLRGAQGLGLRVPAHPVLRQILAAMSMPLASTSANLHGQPVLTQEAAVLQTFDGQVDYMVLDGTLSPTASAVLDVTANPARLLRAGEISKIDLQRVLGAPIV